MIKVFPAFFRLRSWKKNTILLSRRSESERIRSQVLNYATILSHCSLIDRKANLETLLCINYPSLDDAFGIFRSIFDYYVFRFLLLKVINATCLRQRRNSSLN